MGSGRALEYYDMPTVRGIEREASGKNYRFSSLILGRVVKSTEWNVDEEAQHGTSALAEAPGVAARTVAFRRHHSLTVAARTEKVYRNKTQGVYRTGA